MVVHPIPDLSRGENDLQLRLTLCSDARSHLSNLPVVQGVAEASAGSLVGLLDQERLFKAVHSLEM